jgi:hypothetical protein
VTGPLGAVDVFVGLDEVVLDAEVVAEDDDEVLLDVDRDEEELLDVGVALSEGPAEDDVDDDGASSSAGSEHPASTSIEAKQQAMSQRMAPAYRGGSLRICVVSSM